MVESVHIAVLAACIGSVLIFAGLMDLLEFLGERFLRFYRWYHLLLRSLHKASHGDSCRDRPRKRCQRR
jgi:hypothetical protein